MKILFLLILTISGLIIPAHSNSFARNISRAKITSSLVFYQAPRNLQFFARDNQDSANVPISGNTDIAGFDSVYLEVYKNNILWKRKSTKLIYTAGNASFAISQKIHAELSEYLFKLYIKDVKGMNTYQILNADSLVCGDAFIISGQSNSHNTNDTATYKNEFCRSFGVQTPNGNGDIYNPADTNWGISKATSYQGASFTGPYNVGVWGLYLQKQITDSIGIPTCIINGGRRGSSIELNLRDNSNPTNLNTIYGKSLYRVLKSGLANKIKAIFWYQGEANGDNSWMTYANNFQTLYNSWSEDYPGFSKIFLFQVRQGCGNNLLGGLLREVQRQLAYTYSKIELVSTMGIPAHHFDNCHYGFQGYYELSLNLYRQVAKNFYTISNDTDIRPPNIKKAYYTSSSKNEIALIFDNSGIVSWPADSLNQSMKDYFYLNGVYGNISTGIISGSMLKLQLINPSNASKLTYLPSKYNNGTQVVYQGPFLRNSRGIGALSFNDFPITNPSTLNLTSSQQGYYSQSHHLNISDTITVILRNSFSPYLIRDSAKAVIDSISFTGSFNFYNIPNGDYYIVIKSRNGLETWSSDGTNIISNSTASYNFTSSASMAFGNNMILINNKYCIYSGDINQDGYIDLTDIVIINNDVADFVNGYVATDLNGDYITDLEDNLIAYNNSVNFVSKVTP